MARMLGLALAVGVLLGSSPSFAEEWQTRSWEELKTEAQGRADRGAYPLAGLNPDDVKTALSRIRSLDRDDWAVSWIAQGDIYRNLAKAEEPSDKNAALKDYRAAWRLYAFGRWPVTNSRKKLEAYGRERLAFQSIASLSTPAIEIVHIPFEGQEIVGYLQRPAGIAKPPVVIDIGGVDSWKETVAIDSQPFLKAGIADFAVDMPGTGEAPLPGRPGSERMYSAVIDALRARSDVDGDRLAVRGESWGSYWAARAAFAEPRRLKGAVFQSGPVDAYFSHAWQDTSLKTKEYLFDFVPSRLFILGMSNVDQMLDFMPAMSLKPMLEQPTPPMLLVGGMHDTQTPFSDLQLLLTSGSAKFAWINPNGGHMGRSLTLKDETIFETVVLPWIIEQLQPAHN